jgi:putative spermidine/putrescine transport system substrate-binding protein
LFLLPGAPPGEEDEPMPRSALNRRQLLQTGAAAAAMAWSGAARAAPGLVATTYPGAWEIAQRQYLLPAAAKATGVQIALEPVLALEAVAKIKAARGNPPYDVALLDEGPYLAALADDIFAPLTPAGVPNLAQQGSRFVDPNGRGAFVSAQVMGLIYNPKTVRNAPTSWLDLWRPEFKGRVGITGLGSSLGTAWLVEIAKLHGGSEANMEPGFAAVKKLLPNVGAVAASPGALATLFQQGQIDISYNFFNGILPLVQNGVDIAFARPDSGWVMVRNSLHAIANSRAPEQALAYINAALSAEVQSALAGAPNFLAATNRTVPFTGELLKIARNSDDLAACTLIDWATINPQRPALIERFNKEIRI